MRNNYFNQFFSKSLGFTIVELVVAIAIVALLTTIGLVVFTGQEKAARLTKVQQDMEAMSKEIEISREAQSKVFYDLIGGDDWADRYCRLGYGSNPSGKVKDRPDCISEITSDWSNFTNMQVPIDPWGDIYTFDANEYEPFYFYLGGAGVGPPRYCRWDIITSAGPDGISRTADDFVYYVSPKNCSIKEECEYTPGTVIHGKRNFNSQAEYDTIAPDCHDPNP